MWENCYNRSREVLSSKPDNHLIKLTGNESNCLMTFCIPKGNKFEFIPNSFSSWAGRAEGRRPQQHPIIYLVPKQKYDKIMSRE